MSTHPIPVLECRELSKSYVKGVKVLHGLNITLFEGKIVGLLGPNGCGKSTLIKLISGLLTPDSGDILVCGKSAVEERNALISYLPERTYFNNSMKVSELIELFKDFYEDFDESRALAMLSDMMISPEAKLKELSKGTKEKVQLIMVMSRRAKLYLLDEPIAGVDPAARDYILNTIIKNYDPSAAIIITTHLIHDIESILDEFIFFGYGGQILMSGNAEEARKQNGKSLDELFREVFKCSRSF